MSLPKRFSAWAPRAGYRHGKRWKWKCRHVGYGMNSEEQWRPRKIEDVAVCNSYSLARDYADGFARTAPPNAIVTVYECKTLKRNFRAM